MTNNIVPCVIDASIAVKLFLPEEGTDEVQSLFTEYIAVAQPACFCVPDLLFVECANILWKRVRRGELDESLALQHLADLRALSLPSVPTESLMERALEIALRYDLTAYDGCYVALADQQRVPLFTADDRLLKKLQESPFAGLGLNEYFAAR